MPAPKLTKKTVGSVLATGASLAIPFITTYLGVADPTAQFVILTGGLNAVGALSGGLATNYLQSEIIDKTPKDELLTNGDLTRAIGQTVFAICNEYATVDADSDDKKLLEKLSDEDFELWKDLILGGSYQDGSGLHLNDIDLSEVEAAKIIQYAKIKEGKFDEIKTLEIETWKKVIQTLSDKKQIPLSQKAIKGVAEKLYNEFAQHLRTIIVADSANGGKAFASFQYRILGEILHYTEQNNGLLEDVKKLDKKTLEVVIALYTKVDDICQNSPKETLQKDSEHWDKVYQEFSELTEALSLLIKLGKTNIKLGMESVKVGRENQQYLKRLIELIENQPKTKIEIAKGLINFQREGTPYFIEQGGIFGRVDEHFKNKNIACLRGIHGLGKTTTVIKYAHRVVDDYEFIIYIPSAKDALEQELAKLADRFVEGQKVIADQTDKANEFKRFLKGKENWLLIFDNLEVQEHIEKFFPKFEHGKILYTCNEPLFIGEDCEVKLNKFSQTEAELFLFQKVNKNKTADNTDIPADELKKIKALIDELGNLPLALNIAGAYINENLLNKTGDENHYDVYLEYLSTAMAEVLELVDNHDEYKKIVVQDENGEGKEELINVIAAFNISLEKITTPKDDSEKANIIAKLAETFLNLIAFCSPDDIPEDFISQTLFEFVDTSNVATPQQILWADTITLLENFDFIKAKRKADINVEKLEKPIKGEDGQTTNRIETETEINVYDIHRTLQKVLFVKLEDETKINYLKSLIAKLKDLLTYEQDFDWKQNTKYVVHAESLLKYQDTLAINSKDVYLLSFNVARYFQNLAQYQYAIENYVRSLAISKEVYGEKHPPTASSYNNLGIVYYSLGRYEEAEFNHQRDLAIRLEVYGEKHPSTATSYNNLGLVYNSLGRYEEAEFNHQKDLEITLEVYGEKHPSTASSYNNLGNVYYSLGRYEEAMNYYKKTLAIFREYLPENHPNIKLVVDNIENTKAKINIGLD